MSKPATTVKPLPRVAYTPTEVSEMLGINRVTIYKLIREGRLPARRVGERSLRIRQEDIDKFLANMASGEELGDE